MHGHGFEVELHVGQVLGDTDMGVDFDQIKEAADALRAELHLHCLNDIEGLENPTSELLAAWIWQRIQADLPDLSYVSVRETATAGCAFDGQNYRIWKEARFESAVRLLEAPKEDAHRSLHGHSYFLRMHLQSDLDQVMGWTVDFGDVKQVFAPVGDYLDHHQLDVLEELESADSISVARWIGEQLQSDLPQLSRLELFETPSRGVLLMLDNQTPSGAL
jgi:6-pyruvoyltetrahydropterin/6-carboxytetrahydropterin synthase